MPGGKVFAPICAQMNCHSEQTRNLGFGGTILDAPTERPRHHWTMPRKNSKTLSGTPQFFYASKSHGESDESWH